MLVICPAFVSDCLETIEEIGIRGCEQFMAGNGKEFTRIPCMNEHPLWIDGAGKNGAKIFVKPESIPSVLVPLMVGRTCSLTVSAKSRRSRFSFLAWRLRWFALVAAQRAEKQRLAAFASHHMDTFAAHDFAGSACICRSPAIAGGAGKRIVPLAKTTGGFGRSRSNSGIATLTSVLSTSSSTSPSRTSCPASSHVSMTGSPLTNVPLVESQSRMYHAIVRQRPFRNARRNRGVDDGKIAVRVAPDAIDAEAQFQSPVFQTLRLDEQSGHIASKLSER